MKSLKTFIFFSFLPTFIATLSFVSTSILLVPNPVRAENWQKIVSCSEDSLILDRDVDQGGRVLQLVVKDPRAVGYFSEKNLYPNSKGEIIISSQIASSRDFGRWSGIYGNRYQFSLTWRDGGIDFKLNDLHGREILNWFFPHCSQLNWN